MLCSLVANPKVVRKTVPVHGTVIVLDPLVNQHLGRRFGDLTHRRYNAFGRFADKFGKQIIGVGEHVFLLLRRELIRRFMRVSVETTNLSERRMNCGNYQKYARLTSHVQPRKKLACTLPSVIVLATYVSDSRAFLWKSFKGVARNIKRLRHVVFLEHLQQPVHINFSGLDSSGYIGYGVFAAIGTDPAGNGIDINSIANLYLLHCNGVFVVRRDPFV